MWKDFEYCKSEMRGIDLGGGGVRVGITGLISQIPNQRHGIIIRGLPRKGKEEKEKSIDVKLPKEKEKEEKNRHTKVHFPERSLNVFSGGAAIIALSLPSFPRRP